MMHMHLYAQPPPSHIPVIPPLHLPPFLLLRIHHQTPLLQLQYPNVTILHGEVLVYDPLLSIVPLFPLPLHCGGLANTSRSSKFRNICTCSGSDPYTGTLCWARDMTLYFRLD